MRVLLDEDPEELVIWAGPRVGQQPVRIGADRFEVDRETEVEGRGLKPPEMILKRERTAVIDANNLEHAITAQQALVGRRDHRLGGEHDLAVE